MEEITPIQMSWLETLPQQNDMECHIYNDCDCDPIYNHRIMNRGQSTIMFISLVQHGLICIHYCYSHSYKVTAQAAAVSVDPCNVHGSNYI
jgi:hypothetical protein